MEIREVPVEIKLHFEEFSKVFLKERNQHINCTKMNHLVPKLHIFSDTER